MSFNTGTPNRKRVLNSELTPLPEVRVFKDIYLEHCIYLSSRIICQLTGY